MARGYIFEVTKDPDYLGLMSERDFYDLSGREFSYVEDMDAGSSKDCVARFIVQIHRLLRYDAT